MNLPRLVTNGILGLSLWASLNGSLTAQEAPAANGPSVRVLVTVEAVHGSDVPVMNREDVMVHEGRERDKVIDWVPARGDRAALELVILLDDSSNITLGTKLEELRKFIGSQPDSTKIAVDILDKKSAKYSDRAVMPMAGELGTS